MQEWYYLTAKRMSTEKRKNGCATRPVLRELLVLGYVYSSIVTSRLRLAVIHIVGPARQ